MARVLLVHDDPSLRQEGRRALVREGHEVVEVDATGLAGALARGRFDLAVAARGVGAAGVELLARVRAAQPDCGRVLLGAPSDAAVLLDAVNRAEVARIVPESDGMAGVARALREVLTGRQDLAGWLEQRRQEEHDTEARHLQEALAAGALEIAFQPIVEAGSERIVAHEVLARTPHPAFPTTGRLVEAAQRAQQLPLLTRAVVERLAATLARTPTAGHFFVNLHPGELSRPDQVVDALQPLAPHAHRVVVEITERGAVLPEGGWVETVEELAARGFAVAVDDLGAGQSSLRMLAELQPQFVKVDMSVVRDVDAEPARQRLVELLCRFADTTGAKVIAEGVETRLEADTLARIGVSLLQGYLFGRPQPEPVRG